MAAAAALATAGVGGSGDGGEGGEARRLVAWAVPRPGADLSAEGLRRDLGARLPPYLVPAHLLLVADLPRTLAGKVDRRALARQAEALDAAEPAREPAAPRTPAERFVAGLWQQVLGLARVGVADDFFAAGGNSLQAAVLTNRLQEELGEPVYVVALFDAPTVEQLAARLLASHPAAMARVIGAPVTDEVAPAVPARRLARRGLAEARLSFSQERFWFLERLSPGSGAYHIPGAAGVRGALDVPVLAAALAALVARHETLRTTFALRPEGPVQVVHPAPPDPFALPLVDLSALPDARRQPVAEDLAAAEARRPFDLAAGPLLRTVALRLAAASHRILFTLHHVVADGWSIGVLLRELAALYPRCGGTGGGAPELRGLPGLPELPVQYADFAEWQREELSGAVLAGQLAYWRERLGGAPRLLELPLDRPRPAVPAWRGRQLAVDLPPGLGADLQALSRRHGTTLFMTLLAGLAALLGRHAGQEQVVIGTPIAGRNRREVEGLIGCFVNTLALAVDLGEDPALPAHLARVRQTALGAFAHQDLPFEQVVEAVAPERNLSAAPLFQVMFALQDGPAGRFDVPGLEMELLATDVGTAKFDLVLALGESGGGLAGTWSYRADLFDAPTVERLNGHLANLLAAAAVDRPERLSQLSLLSAAERQAVLVEWNDLREEYPREGWVAELVLAQAARTPAAPAVVFGGVGGVGGETQSYGELAMRARRLAARLRQLGVGPEAPVGVYLERCLDLPAVVLGVLAAGGVYLPLDPSYPAERLDFMLADASRGGRDQGAGGPLVVTAAGLLARLPTTPAFAAARTLLCEEWLGEEWLGEGLAGEPMADPLPAAPLPEQAAYLLYTSGSTGWPKGVVVSHRSLANRLLFQAAQLAPSDSFLQKTPISFDVSLVELLVPLLAGGRTVLAGPGGVQDSSDYLRLIAGHGISHASFPPSMLALLLEDPEFPGLTSLRTVATGGEAVPADLAGRFRARHGAVLLNRYGPTETTISMTAWRCEPEQAGPPPIGRPLAGASVYLLDRGLQPVPAGIGGEIFIGGPGVARGYLGRPELTAAAFRPDPFGAEAGARLYRTGDLARQRVDGVVEFLGRVDRQVKVRGFRVELGEIEAALAGHPGVREAAVVDRPDGATRRLVAWYVRSGGPWEADSTAAAGNAELRAFLSERLPDWMVPSAFAALPALPLSPTGKVDRQALAQLALTEAAEAGSEVAEAARTPSEELLASLWEDLLGVRRAGPADDFFALGGHSLLATRLVSRVRDVFGVELPLRAVFEAPTLAAMAARLEAERSSAAGSAAPPLLPREIGTSATGAAGGAGEDVPLSFAQQRLWFLDQLEPGTTAYHLPAALHLTGGLDVAALGAAFDGLVRRHEALRTTFAGRAGTPVQVIAPAPAPLSAPLTDLAALPAAAAAAELGRAQRAQLARPFDLAAGPLLRLLLVRLGPREHVLVVTLHHIVSDGWSLEVLVREVGVLYGAAAARRPAPLAPLPVQYADFARWQRGWLAGAALDGQLAYWRTHLAGAPRLLELPTDRPRPVVPSWRGRQLAAAFAPGQAADLRALSRRHGTTLFMTLLAGLAALLGRHAGQDRVVVGTPVAGRGRREVEGLIGFFVNTLALHVDLGDDPGLAALLAGVREAALGAYGHQDVPFEQVVEAVAPERNLSATPLFQVMFALQNTPPARFDVPGLEVAALPLETGTAKFDLVLALGESGGGLAGTWSYRADLFDASTVERLNGHLANLLAAAAAGGTERLSQLALLSAAERQAVLVEWNDLREEYPREGWVAELVLAQAARTPAAPAVIFSGEVQSYGELAMRTGRLAARLRQLGVGPEAPVGVYLERCLDLPAVVLGVLAAGGVYLPLDPSYPAERLDFLLGDAFRDGAAPASPLVVTSAGLLERLPRTAVFAAARTLLLENLLDEGLEAPAGAVMAVRPPISPEQAAYLLYTSGSTGRPKGVVVSHRSLANRLLFQAARHGAADSFLQKTPISFDVSLVELLLPLLSGSRTVLAPPGALEPSDYLRLIAGHGVAHISFPPSMLALLLEEPGFSALASLRSVTTGGEAVPAELAVRFGARHGAALLNRYGPTEATISMTVWRCLPEEAGPPPIGRPLAGASVVLLDRRLQPVPSGVTGEIFIGGPGVARGYLSRPELTAEAFRPDPYAGTAGGRLYRTGDLARQRVGGVLEFLGRVDRQVKVRGFRVELGEIEAALASHPGVREAAVVDRPEGPTRRLVAWFVRSGAAAGAVGGAELRAHLSARLPDWMVPSAFAALPALPLTPTGKVDRRALAQLTLTETVEAGSEVAEAAARTPSEELLAGLWEDLLGVRRAGPADDFFALGGHSLLATRLVSRVRELFGVELPLRGVFEAPTLAAMAARLESERSRADGSPAPPLLPCSSLDDELPLSFAQQRLWFLDQLRPGTAAYNLPAALRLAGELDIAALHAAFGGLVERHETLRTTFAVRAGEPVQVVAPPAPPALPLVDLAALQPAAAEAELRRQVSRLAGRPFDLAAGPLLRLCLLRLAAAEHVLLVAQHHIVTDGWSMAVLVRDVGALYADLTGGGEIEGRGTGRPLAPLPLQYRDFAAWQRGWLAGAALESQLAYWRGRLAAAPPVAALPLDRPRRALGTVRGRAVPAELGAGVQEGLRTLCRQQGVTPFMVLLAALSALVARLGGQDQVVVGSPIAGRTRRELEDLIGLFLNMLALSTDLAGDPPGRRLLGRVREATLGAYAHQDLPFEKLVAELEPARDLSHTPLFQVMLAFQNTPEAELELPGLALGPFGGDLAPAKFDLTLNLADRGGRIAGRWLYNAELFDAATAARLSGQLATLLDALAQDPETRLSELPLLTAAERQQLREWNAGGDGDGDGATAPGGDLLAGFREWARREPERTAVVWNGGRLSYGELAARSRRLARQLRRLGVGPNVPVGLCAERSPALLAGLLAVVEAGGAYVPLDPADPTERLAHLAADARLPVLLAAPGLEERLAAVAAAAAVGAVVVALDDDASLDEGDELEPGVPAGADDLLYVIYTSGSTGLPKGAGVRRGSFANLLGWYVEELGFAAGEAQLVLSSPSFDLTQKSLLAPLLTGGRLCLAPAVYDPAALLALIAAEGVARLNCTPSAFYPLAEGRQGAGLESLRAVVLGGEPIAPERLAGLYRAAPGARVINSYGPTECTDVVAFHVVERPSPHPVESAAPVEVPIGRPLPGVELLVTDGALYQLPVGAVGELCVGGIAVAAGYLGDAARTAERFVPHPGAAAAGARLYRTGDLARRLPDGRLSYVGRTDGQVKVRGFRIELGEVEAQLRSHPEVREAAALVRRQDDSAALVAVVVAGGGEPAADLPARLVQHLAARLPEHMVPARVVLFAALPLSPNGKVDRRALANLDLAQPTGTTPGGTARLLPRTPVESAVAALFREVLGTGPMAVADSFFELGGDSIRGAVLINRLQERLGELVHVVAIFDHPTVAALAAYLEREHPAAVARTWGVTAHGLPAADVATAAIVDEAAVERLRALIPPFQPAAHRPAPTRRSRRAVFVLSPPRSGSTLLRVMLAGHPGLFAPPELELLNFPDLAARRAALSGRDSFWREGLIRAVMAARGESAEAARERIEQAEDAALPAEELYGLLQEWIGDRVLVDKSPSYALDGAVLARAEEVFADARYVHLLRHPGGMIHSFEEARLEQVFFRYPHTLGRRELAELIWIVSQRNILAFLADIPAERRHQVEFERLVREPEAVLRELCGFLEIAYRPAMADPYGDLGGRMTDGLTAVSRMVGDVKLLQHRRVDPQTAERWREAGGEALLGEPARALARRLGYEIAPSPGDELRIVPGLWQPDRPLPLSFAQERLWFLERLVPGGAGYHIPAGLRLAGALDRGALAGALAQVVRRHASLRTRFGEVDGAPFQVVTAEAAVELPLVDLSALPYGRREAAVNALFAVEARRAFDLTRGPLLRAALVCLDRPGAHGADRGPGEAAGAGEHVLLFNLHHIVADGWSTSVLVREVTAFYAAAVGGLPSPLPALPVQFADYALWQRRRLRGAQLDAEVAFWRDALAGAPPLDLPTDRPRPAVLSSRGARLACRVGPAVAAPLLALGTAQGTTPFMTLLAGFAALLHRLSGADDLSIGTPVAGRNRAELEDLIGCFVNTLVLRIGLAPAAGPVGIWGSMASEGDGPTVLELLARTRAATLAAFGHQELPFEKVVEELRPRRDPGRTPLFQTMFSLQNVAPAWDETAAQLPGLTLGRLALPGEQARFDLSLNLRELPGRGLVGEIEYHLDLFEAASIARFAGQLATLFAALPEHPGRPVAELPLLSAAERHQLLELGAGPPFPDRGDTAALLVHQRFARQAALQPAAPALVLADGETWTYGQLAGRVGALAARLRALGVGPEVTVAVCLPRSPGLVAALLAVLEAGGVYLPLDPDYPRERLAFLLADAGAAVVCTERRLLDVLPQPASGELRPVLLLDEPFPLPAPAAGEPAHPLPASLAYVIYTSGSSGRPKGVGVTQAGLRDDLRAVQEHCGFAPGERVLLFSSPSFDVSLEEILGPLIAGAALCLAPAAPWDVATFLDLVRELGLTVVSLPTAFWHPWAQECVRHPLPPDLALRCAVVGGEAMAPAVARLWLRSPWGAVRLLNGYGPTEAVISATFLEVTAEAADGPGAAVPLGRPLAGRTARVLDRRGRTVPAGVLGELCLGGVLARGYLGRPELTAERFVPDPGGAPGGRLYRTGDLARWVVGGGGGGARIPRPHRPAGQDPGPADRAGRDRVGARRPSCPARSGGGDGRRPRRRPPPHRLRRPSGERYAARSAGAARLPGRAPARLPGPRGGCLRPAGGVAAHPQRQGRPRGARPPGGRPRARRPGGLDRPPHAAGGAGRRHLVRGAGAGAGWRRGRLLRARRALAARHPRAVAAARPPGGRGRSVAAVRGSDPGRLRGGGRGGRRRAAACRRGARPAAAPAARRRPTALLRPGAAVVPRPAAARLGGLPHAGRPAAHRQTRLRGPARHLRRGDPPPRGAAHGLRAAWRLAGAGHRAPRPAAAAGDRSGRPAGRGGGARAAAPGRRGGRAALRPRHRPAAAPAVAAPGPGRARAGRDAAPHRLGRLVDGCAGAGDRRPLQRLRLPPAAFGARPAGAADPVRRLCGLAARLAPGGGPGGPAELLARAPGRRARRPRPARRPAAPQRPPARPQLQPGARAGADARPPGLLPAGGCDALHGPARRARGSARPVERPPGPARRRGGGLADRRPQPARAGGPDRLPAQHPGAAHRARRSPHRPRAARPGAPVDPRRLRPPGPAVREAGGRPGRALGNWRAGPRPVAHTRLPGHAGAPQHPGRGARAARPHPRSARAGPQPGQVRPDALPDRGAGAAGGAVALQRRAVRRRDDRSALRRPARDARRSRRRPRRAAVGDRPAVGGGAPPAGGGVQCRPGRDLGRGAGRGLHPRAVRGGGGGAGRGDRGGVRGRELDVWRVGGAGSRSG